MTDTTRVLVALKVAYTDARHAELWMSFISLLTLRVEILPCEKIRTNVTEWLADTERFLSSVIAWCWENYNAWHSSVWRASNQPVSAVEQTCYGKNLIIMQHRRRFCWRRLSLGNAPMASIKNSKIKDTALKYTIVRNIQVRIGAGKLIFTSDVI